MKFKIQIDAGREHPQLVGVEEGRDIRWTLDVGTTLGTAATRAPRKVTA